ncbi:AbiV family abortive infection protein [Pimelobacter simplex]|uniref:AbiV family abortive infection protein n=1 Tax=Nocardioides simplex TaxID=2045 RepID=UPI0036716167
MVTLDAESARELRKRLLDNAQALRDDAVAHCDAGSRGRAAALASVAFAETSRAAWLHDTFFALWRAGDRGEEKVTELYEHFADDTYWIARGLTEAAGFYECEWRNGPFLTAFHPPGSEPPHLVLTASTLAGWQPRGLRVTLVDGYPHLPAEVVAEELGDVLWVLDDFLASAEIDDHIIDTAAI